MPENISLDSIQMLKERPRYILTAGGIGSGKSYTLRLYAPSIPVMDVDDVMAHLGFTDYNNHDNFSLAMDIISGRINTMMLHRECLIAMGTSSSMHYTINKLFWAKQKGYTTVLVHIDAPVGQCLAQNEERRLKGKRAVEPKDLGRIEQTCIGSALVAATLSKTDLVDYFCHHQNIR